jgi:RNA polymerase sigma-70 factor (ECF subfamily)
MAVQSLNHNRTELLYERAFDEHWRDVLRFLVAWTNDWSAAEDLAQDTFLRLWTNRARFDWEQPVRPWLLTTARRLATDRFRMLRRRLGGSRSTSTLDEAGRLAWLDVQAEMRVLSSLERTAVVLTSIVGHSPAETGEILGITPGAVRSARTPSQGAVRRVSRG